MAREHALPAAAQSLTIEHWRECLLGCAGVTKVDRLVHPDGTSRKSEVAEKTVAAGGGHLTPYELYVYVGGHDKAQRFTAGLSRHGGYLHTYYRTPSQRLGEKAAADVFREGCLRLEAMLADPGTPAKKSGTPAKPAPAVRCLAAHHGEGPEYLSFTEGDMILPRKHPPNVRGAGWAYGLLLKDDDAKLGWFPPTYAELPLRFLTDFDGRPYGLDCLCCSQGDVVVPKKPPYAAADGWAYGALPGGAEGWYSSSCVDVPAEPLVLE